MNVHPKYRRKLHSLWSVYYYSTYLNILITYSTIISKYRLSSVSIESLTGLKREPERMYVHLNNDQDRSVWTMKVHQESANLPLVMLHGMGAGIGLWLKNIEELSIDRSLYAFDLPGFGRSFRDKYQNFKTAEEAENFFTDAIETWRKSMSLNAFILLGHSFGGYLASAYALKYPAHVKGLILVDAWGFSRRQKENLHLSRRFKLGLAVYKTLSPNPLSFLRAAGSWGLCFIFNNIGIIIIFAAQ